MTTQKKTNVIYNEDCIEGMKKLPEGSMDLVVTSPPYDDIRNYKGYSFQFEEVARGLFRVMKEGGVIIWVVGDATIEGSETGTSFKQALYFKEVGFKLYDTMIFHKETTPINARRYEQHFEYMFVLSKGMPKTFNPIKELKKWKDNRKKKPTHRNKEGEFQYGSAGKSLMKVKGNVWKYNTGGGHNTKDKIAYNHPAIYPEKLVEDHILSWSNPGDLILDPFIGSGTTAKMCLIHGREFIGFDISEEYCKIANERIKSHRQQTKLFTTQNTHNVNQK